MTDHKLGVLYVVATPIGNLEDMSPRAVRVLREVALIACEDTRHSAKLATHFGIDTELTALHDFNERDAAAAVLSRLSLGQNIALISDAGTPLLSDPGYRLIRLAHDHQIPVRTVPGPSAVVAGLSVSGMPTDRFAFEGFPPPKRRARQALFLSLATEPRTLIFFESPHRIEACLADMVDAFGSNRDAAIARELTKRFETVRLAALGTLVEWLRTDTEQRQGEFVVLVSGANPETAAERQRRDAQHILMLLLHDLPVTRAVALAAEITGENRNFLYRYALEHRT